MKPYWSAGAKTANVIAAIANGAIRRTSKSTLVARGSLSIASSLYGGSSRRPRNGGSALEQIRHVGDDRVPPEEQRTLDQKGRLVVQDVLPPVPWQELREHDGDHLLVPARLDLVEIVQERPQERAVRRGQDDQGDAEAPLAPLLLEAGRSRRVRLDVHGAHHRGRRERPGILHGPDDAPMHVADQHQDRVLEPRRALETFEGQLARDLLVVTMHDDEHGDQDA